MASFSARARKYAWDSQSNAEDDSTSSISGGISRRSTGDTTCSKERSTSQRGRSADIGTERSCSCSGQTKSQDESIVEKKKRELLLERRVVSFPLEEQDSVFGSKEPQHITRLPKDTPIERFVAAFERDGEVIVEGLSGADVKFESLD